MADAVEQAAEILGPGARRSEPLAPMTTYRVGGPAALFVRARSLDDLRRVAAARQASGLPVLVVGRGSNLLVADDGFPGIAVAIAELAGEIELPATTASRARRLPSRRVAASPCRCSPGAPRRPGSPGLEWAVGVPGSVGGAVRMNAGGHGSDMAACLLDVDIVDLGRRPTW